MALKYLLPCSCGHKTPVEAVQAGETLTCTCGRKIEVPTLLRLRTLDTLDADAQPAAPQGWRVAQGVAAVGAAVMLLAVAGLALCVLYRPTPPSAIFTAHAIHRDTGNLTLLGSYQVWDMLRQGPGNSPPAGDRYLALLKTYRIPKYATIEEAYATAAKQYHIRVGIAVVVFAIAAVTTIAGWIISRRRGQDMSQDEVANAST